MLSSFATKSPKGLHSANSDCELQAEIDFNKATRLEADRGTSAARLSRFPAKVKEMALAGGGAVVAALAHPTFQPSIFNAEMNASWGISTLPNWRIPAIAFGGDVFSHGGQGFAGDDQGRRGAAS